MHTVDIANLSRNYGSRRGIWDLVAVSHRPNIACCSVSGKPLVAGQPSCDAKPYFAYPNSAISSHEVHRSNNGFAENASIKRVDLIANCVGLKIV